MLMIEAKFPLCASIKSCVCVCFYFPIERATRQTFYTEKNKSKKAHYKLPECPESSFARPDNSFARYLFGPLAPLQRENEAAPAIAHSSKADRERRRRGSEISRSSRLTVRFMARVFFSSKTESMTVAGMLFCFPSANWASRWDICFYSGVLSLFRQKI